MLDLLRCPRCRAERPFSLHTDESSEAEVRSGSLTCGACGAVYAVAGGIVDLLADAPEYVRAEAAGLERFAEVMRRDGWDRARVLRLPDEDLPYWRGQRAAIDHVLRHPALRPGGTIVDVGSNTCWASNLLARAGLQVVALDIARTQMQGLETADWWFEDGGVYFERLLSMMNDNALASESMDHAFCCEVLHHNDVPNLRATFAELHRVLRPGGTLFVVNEPMRFLLNRKRDHGEEVAEFEGNEHVYHLHEYVLAARSAGFVVERPWRTRVDRAPSRLRRASRAARFGWYSVVRGDPSLYLTCRKTA